MAVTLVVNPGSSSKKYALFRDGREILRVEVSQTEKDIRYAVRRNDAWLEDVALAEGEYEQCISKVVETAQAHRCISSAADITKIGLRLVAPGREWQYHQCFTDTMVERLHAVNASAPLHIPPVLAEYQQLRTAFPEVSIVAASDSAFHNTMPAPAAHYSIPTVDREQLGVQRYGYHGLSVSSVMQRLHAVTGKNFSRVVVCHIGSGVSVTAVRDGVSVDTSMGYAPGSGAVMGSRAGDLDTGALLELLRAKSMSVSDAHHYLQKEGGLQALADESDIRHLLERTACGDPAARAALAHFAYHIRKQIGVMLAALGGVDAVVCTATAGERSPELRSCILAPLADLGITLDPERNDTAIAREMVISPHQSPVCVVVIPTDELGEIVRVVDSIR